MFERVLNTPMAFVAEYLIAVVLNELKHLIDIVLRYYNAHKKRSLRDFNRFFIGSSLISFVIKFFVSMFAFLL